MCKGMGGRMSLRERQIGKDYFLCLVICVTINKYVGFKGWAKTFVCVGGSHWCARFSS